MVEGELRQTPYGTCLVVEKSYPLTHNHGRYPLAEAFKEGAGRLLVQGGDRRLEEFNPKRALFIDTETTGLAMGAGTYAFLVGVGLLRGDNFHVYQFFMRDFSEEAALLHLFGELLEETDFLVSFNGKSYDVPLLENRFIMARMAQDFGAIPHLDLLYTARRLWKHRLEDCRLSTVEQELLGVRRSGDIQGHQIPQVFFDYLRGERHQDMARVFHHNLLDILSLALLGGVINGMIADPQAVETGDGGEMLALGRLWEEAEMGEEGRRAYQKALELDMAPEQRRDAMARLSLIHKREGRWEEAISIWEQMMADDSEDVFPYQELAKYYEHRAGDFHRALGLVEEALEMVRFSQRWYGDAAANIVGALEHRRARLRTRAGIEEGP